MFKALGGLLIAESFKPKTVIKKKEEEQMRKNKLIVTVTALIVISCLLLSLGFLSASNTYIFSKNLTIKDTPNISQDPDHWFDLYDGDEYFGEVVIRVRSPIGAITKIIFDTPNTHEGYVVDSIVLKFSTGTNNPAKIYMKCDYPAVPTTFQHDSYGTTVKIDGMEVYGGYSAPSTFLLESYSNTTLSITADVTYHETSLLQLNALKAHISVDTQIEIN